jgi:heat shock protein HtpX
MKRSIQDQIQANKTTSVFYAMLMVVLLTALGAGITGFWHRAYWMYGAAGAAVLGLILALVAVNAGDDIILSLSGAREATHQDDQTLDNVAEEMAIAAGIPKPRVYVIDDPSPNAFATGKDPQNGTVVFTTGIIQKLKRDELQGVMAHEMSHIRNYDIRFMTTIAIVAGVIPLLADVLLRMGWFGGGRSRDRDDSGGAQAIFMIVAIVLAILAPLFALLLQMAVSRRREMLADASAAELTRYPEGLASALRKIALDPEPLASANRATQHMYIMNPLRGDGGASLFDTHPPVEERIKALESLMGVYEGEREPSFDVPQRPQLPGQGN